MGNVSIKVSTYNLQRTWLVTRAWCGTAVCRICITTITWWRHSMETFSALLTICAGNSPATGEFPTQRPVTRNFHVIFDLRLNKRLSKQSWGWWFDTLLRLLWHHCYEIHVNSWCAKLFSRNISMHLQLISLLHADMTQVVEILPHVIQRPT